MTYSTARSPRATSSRIRGESSAYPRVLAAMTDLATAATIDRISAQIRIATLDLQRTALILGSALLAVTSGDERRATAAQNALAKVMAGGFGDGRQLVQALAGEVETRRAFAETEIGRQLAEAGHAGLPVQALEDALAGMRGALDFAKAVAGLEMLSAVESERGDLDPLADLAAKDAEIARLNAVIVVAGLEPKP